MRHNVKNKKLNRTSSHRKAMFSNMAISLVMHEQIRTTVAKAKTIRPIVEKLVTLGKKGDLNAKRKLNSMLCNMGVVNKLCSMIAERYKKRNGGYLRIMRAGFRFGDKAPVAIIEFVDRNLDSKGRNCCAKGAPTGEDKMESLKKSDISETTRGGKAVASKVKSAIHSEDRKTISKSAKSQAVKAKSNIKVAKKQASKAKKI
jgi:large subunit ribosomal protein L17